MAFQKFGTKFYTSIFSLILVCNAGFCNISFSQSVLRKDELTVLQRAKDSLFQRFEAAYSQNKKQDPRLSNLNIMDTLRDRVNLCKHLKVKITFEENVGYFIPLCLSYSEKQHMFFEAKLSIDLLKFEVISGLFIDECFDHISFRFELILLEYMNHLLNFGGPDDFSFNKLRDFADEILNDERYIFSATTSLDGGISILATLKFNQTCTAKLTLDKSQIGFLQKKDTDHWRKYFKKKIVFVNWKKNDPYRIPFGKNSKP